ncbi:GLPGLI family protein [Elizabethkingia sp. JS20170427COW]|uniref:GLPGLI family protein n=1 Tax=Elizabethkingia sp. JS20170427COW TaxID=2583851 RepID=UPI0011104685|nr:GLPGLI family protein [Elizabethkingia sp. JS20170427COW]QCX53092.1 GLPGLI family protein [Elizabethkingia sp. JS20170427COW]
MKKVLFLGMLSLGLFASAQQTANRFFYEMTYKPKKAVDSLDKEMMVLDITKDKSLYRDYMSVSQDSIMKASIEKMQKSGTFDPDFQKKMKQPKISYQIIKEYPSMKIQYVEMIMNMMKPMYISYTEDLPLAWKIQNESEKIGEYNTQKATLEYGGRKWTAWFSTDIPFQDGPYKFKGLPGLIVKIQDDGNNYSWVLKGNKKVEDFKEKTYAEELAGLGTPQDLSKEKFYKTFNAYKKDPFGSMRQFLTPDVMKQKMPGTNKTMGDYIKENEKQLDKLYNGTDNPIELNSL